LEGRSAGNEAAIGNPAAFAHGEDATLSLSGGNGARYADWVAASWLAYPVQDDLSLGLAFEDIQGGLGPGSGRLERDKPATKPPPNPRSGPHCRR
jgi:hypothetical protein